MNDQEIRAIEAIIKYAKNIRKPFSIHDVVRYRRLDLKLTERVLAILQKEEGYFRFADDRNSVFELTKDGRKFTTWADHLIKEAKEKEDLENKQQLTTKQLDEIELVLADYPKVKRRAKTSIRIAIISALIALGGLALAVFSLWKSYQNYLDLS